MANAAARSLRKRMTPQEVKLWVRRRLLRGEGHYFRRQVPIGGFVVDFACLEGRLVVELDGSGHALHHAARTDTERDARLSALGFRVLRFWNANVDAEPARVVDAILATLTEQRPHPPR